ncbi:ABC transporter permease [Clostridium sp. OS1-26]|uniref:ABC transporter permease n=1 Tax=Clostridium sp. OS1-26 TaxID=3070681 RepID=UPI0027E08798|nr:ABC transporter permease [Clostridium sp. OS1-26]WML34133.1 ABC transporter permease [Clostridium sp. OS1-26]
MITNYGQLTGKYLKTNKKRTLLTIIGIILSVALISSIGLFFKGIQNAQIDDAKNSYGSWQLAFKEANKSLISKITNNPKVSRSGFYTVGEETKLEGKLTTDVIIATDKALELLPYKVKQGKFPENENQVAIEKWALSRIDKNGKIGDKIKVNEKEYTLVGILEDSIGNQIENKGVLLTKNNKIDESKSMLLVEISPKVNLKKAVNELKGLTKKDKVGENTYLLMMQGAGDKGSGMGGLYATLGIIIGIVVISTIAVIYNSFQISVVERIKQFGLLRAVGGTPKQIRKIVLKEATVLAAIGVPLGLVCGIIAIYGISFAFKLIGGESIFPMKPVIDPNIMAISGGVGLISIYLSALIPAIFAGRISPLVAISSRTAITKEKIKRRKNRVIGKVFGFEAALAVKNIKRNKKRYRVTVFSIVISIVLFITFKSFMDMTLTIGKDANESKNIHFSVIRNSQATKEEAYINEKVTDNLKSVNDIDKIYKAYDAYHFDIAIDKSKEIKEIQDMGKVYNKTNSSDNQKTILNGYTTVYDQGALEASKKYLTSGDIDVEKLNRENGVILISKNTIFNDKTQKKHVGPVANIKVGDEIDLQYNEIAGDNNKKIEFDKAKTKKVKVMAIVENEPFNFWGSQEGLKLITTEEVAKKLTNKNSIEPVGLNIIIKDVKNEEAAKTEIETAIKSNSSLRVIDNIEQNRKTKTSILMVKILIYGFVVVVSLIGSVNIINTITTNIILRKREFAALKSIGLTQKGLKKMIVLEGFMYGIVGTIYGSIIACALSFSMYRGLGGVREFAWKFPWSAVATAGIAAIVIGYLSVLSPLSRIRKENLIEAIREDF